MSNPDIFQKASVLLVYFGALSAEPLDDVNFVNNNVENSNEEYTQNTVLQKINLYAVIFINLYIVSFILLIFYCTRCYENNTNSQVVMVEDGDLQNEILLSEGDVSVEPRFSCHRIVRCSTEPFERDWINYENIYENTYT